MEIFDFFDIRAIIYNQKITRGLEIFFLKMAKVGQDNFLILSLGPIELQEKTIR